MNDREALLRIDRLTLSHINLLREHAHPDIVQIREWVKQALHEEREYCSKHWYHPCTCNDKRSLDR